MPSAQVGIRGLLVSLLASCLFVSAAAQAVPHENEGARLASRDEGEAVVQAAWELRRGLGVKPDCSHFVNAIYAQAGLDYEYANSREIFKGIDSFQRVQRPQAGDLVVWQGHIGIVIDPEEHSFYSSVLSGFAIENYRSAYWVRRGRPRFYRYLVDEAHSARVLAHLSPQQVITAPQQLGSVRFLLSKYDPDSPGGRSNQDANGIAPTTPAPGETGPLDPIFVSSHARPSKDEVRAAVIQLADANGKRLPEGDLLDSRHSIALADRFTVVEVNIHDNWGWAVLADKEIASAQTGVKQIAAKRQVALQRQEQGWVLLAPQDRIYLRRDMAVHALSNHLAAMSRGSATSEELKKVVKALDELLPQRTAGATAGGSQ